jgi:hypothetical protein
MAIGVPEDGAHVVGTVEDLVVGEAQRAEAGPGVGLVAAKPSSGQKKSTR